MFLLSINAGSSSLKFTGFEMPEEKVLINGLFERIGISGSCYKLIINGEKKEYQAEISNHEKAVEILLQELINNKIINNYEEIKAVGHRVVHGGEKYTDSIIINDDVERTIEELSSLAPLHNPANLIGIRAIKKILPNVDNVAVFDTAFHQSMDPEGYIYATPYEWYEKYQVRRYGFHGTSHKYIYNTISNRLNRTDLKVISCHLGNGGSVTAIDKGKVLSTSLGFTPLPGIIMGTRCGDIDPSIIPYIMKQGNLTLEEVINDLNKKSGLLGISGVSSDARDVEQAMNEGNKRARLAQEMYENAVVKYIAEYYVLLNKADVICFAGGLGENAINTRKNIIDKLQALNIYIDDVANTVRNKYAKISRVDSAVECYIVPTDEEVMIARDTFELTSK